MQEFNSEQGQYNRDLENVDWQGLIDQPTQMGRRRPSMTTDRLCRLAQHADAWREAGHMHPEQGASKGARGERVQSWSNHSRKELSESLGTNARLSSPAQRQVHRGKKSTSGLS